MSEVVKSGNEGLQKREVGAQSFPLHKILLPATYSSQSAPWEKGVGSPFEFRCALKMTFALVAGG